MALKGEITSRVTMSAPFSARSAMLEVLRALAMTLWPRDRASRAMYFPNPEEAPVMNQTGVREPIVILLNARTQGLKGEKWRIIRWEGLQDLERKVTVVLYTQGR